MQFSCSAQKPFEGPEKGVEHPPWNGQSITFTIRRGSLWCERTLIRATRVGKVEVILPPFLLRKEAFVVIQSRGGWILDRLREIQSCPQLSSSYYTDGEEYLFLGTYRRLRPIVCGAEKNLLSFGEKTGQSVVIGRSQFIQLRADSDDSEMVHKQLLLWYETQTQKHIACRLIALCPCIPWSMAVLTWRVCMVRRR